MKNQKFVITVHYLNTSPLEVEGPLKSIIKKMLEIEDNTGNKPFFLEINKVKYFYNRKIYTDFLNNTYKSLGEIEDLKFEGLCRNKVTLIINGEDVDAGSLWVISKNKATLVDEDNLIETDYNVNLFDVI